jgi:hypothetical protein
MTLQQSAPLLQWNGIQLKTETNTRKTIFRTVMTKYIGCVKKVTRGKRVSNHEQEVANAKNVTVAVKREDT